MGVVAVGGVVEVRVSSFADPQGVNSQSTRITNIAQLYRGDRDCDISNPQDVCRTYENDDKARLDPTLDTKAICGDGILDA